MRDTAYALAGISFFMALPSVAVAEGARPTVAVYADRNSLDESQAMQLANLLSDQLVSVGSLAVVDRQHTQSILAEQSTAAAGQVTPATQAQLGRMLGVNYLLVVRIEALNATAAQRTDVLSLLSKQVSYVTKVTLEDSVSIIDVRSAQVVQSIQDQQTTTSGPSTSANDQAFVSEALPLVLKASATALAPKVDLSKLSSTASAAVSLGRILDVSGDSVTISLGAPAGIQVGQLLDFFTTHSVLNPDTGKTIQTLVKQGTLQVVQVESDYAIAKPLAGSHPVKYQVVRPADR